MQSNESASSGFCFQALEAQALTQLPFVSVNGKLSSVHLGTHWFEGTSC